jgi:pyridinium-3,5-bisthiocarboxylic acid mononucleotide nickel chelatase
VLVALVGARCSTDEHDVVTLIECTIDDLNPQLYPHLFERLLAAGANDVYLTPVLMKKGRPGHVLTVTSTTGAVEELTRIIFAETTTIGIRYDERTRRKLAREEVVLQTEYGPVRMKRVSLEGALRTSPELEEARRIAIARSLPLQSVLRRLQEIAAAADAEAGH